MSTKNRDRLASRTSPIDKQIGKNLQILRNHFGLSQEKLAAILGVSFQQVQKYENGSNRLSAARLYQLHRHFEVPLTFFFNPPLSESDDRKASDHDDNAKIREALSRLEDKRLKNKIAQIIYILCDQPFIEKSK